jgi:DedD protein
MQETSRVVKEHQGLRDVERWKDKIEIRLDNRQVAFLFFGSALIACLLFILGVIVGKRLESRGHAVAPEIEDPLALLDRVASTLPGSAPAAPRPSGEVAVSRAGGAQPTRRAPAPEALAVAVAPAPKLEEVAPPAPKPAAAKKVDVAPPKPEPAPIAELTPEPRTVAVKAKPSAPVAPAAKAAAPAEQPRAASPELLPPSALGGAVAVAPAAVTAVPAGAAAAAGKRFMLQIGSFQDQAEAEAFASSFASERPVVVKWALPEKGVWYRVRVGEFRAFKEAVDAKLSFEKRFNKIALVVGPL